MNTPNIILVVSGTFPTVVFNLQRPLKSRFCHFPSTIGEHGVGARERQVIAAGAFKWSSLAARVSTLLSEGESEASEPHREVPGFCWLNLDEHFQSVPLKVFLLLGIHEQCDPKTEEEIRRGFAFAISGLFLCHTVCPWPFQLPLPERGSRCHRSRNTVTSSNSRRLSSSSGKGPRAKAVLTMNQQCYWAPV